MKWDEFKNTVEALSLQIQVDTESSVDYAIAAYNGIHKYVCVIAKTEPRNTEQIDFEDNWLDTVNSKITTEINVNGLNFDGDELKVKAQVQSTTPTINNPELEYSFTKVDLPKWNEQFYTVTEISGTGCIHAFHLSFNSDRVIVRLEIDGQEIFDVDCEELEDYTISNNNGNGGGNFGSCMWMHWVKHGDHFVFSPKLPFKYNTSFKIMTKANSNSSSRDLEAYQLNYEGVS